MNNSTAARVKKDLLAITVPQKTELVNSFSVAGKVVGNGNGMQYFGAILVKTELSQEKLTAYYQSYAKNEWSCLVQKETTEQVDIPDGYRELTRINPNSGSYYLIYTWGDSDFSLRDLDLRAHLIQIIPDYPHASN